MSNQPPKGPPPFTAKTAMAIAGLFLSAVAAGLNSRMGTLALADIRGIYGFEFDKASWISSFYSAGEMAVVPFVLWFCLAFQMRKVIYIMITGGIITALILPFAGNVYMMAVLRFLQGISCGGLSLIMLASVFIFMPLNIRVYGFGMFAIVAVFTPNIGIWVTALWTDILHIPEMIYLQYIPLGIISLVLIRFFPTMPANINKLRGGNWFGIAMGASGLILLVLGLDQGMRLDWVNSSLVTWLLLTGSILTVIYVLTELYHPDPFIKFQVFLEHRNRWLGLTIFCCFLMVNIIASMLPIAFMSRIWEYRPLQNIYLGFMVAFPQLIFMLLVPFLIYREWIDTRILFGIGLSLVAAACFTGAYVDTEWTIIQFSICQLLLGCGLPMVIISSIFLVSSTARSIVDGVNIGTAVNTLRAVGTVSGGALINQFLTNRQNTNFEYLRNHIQPFSGDTVSIISVITKQAYAMAISNAYTLVGIGCLILMLLLSRMRYTPSPSIILSKGEKNA